MTSTPQQWIKQIVESGIASVESIQGCSPEEIAELENHFQVRLPDAYKAFLRAMGKSIGEGFLRDCTITYPYLIKFHRLAERLADAEGFEMPKLAFVFLLHDYQFHYFNTAGGEPDPPTYRFLEGDEKPVQTFGSFTAWMSSVVGEETQAWKELQAGRK